MGLGARAVRIDTWHVGLLVFLVCFGAGISDACEAMSGGDYRDPPEYLVFPPETASDAVPTGDDDTWDVGFRGLSASYARKDWVRSDETLTSWTELVSWNVSFGRRRLDVAQARDAMLQSLAQQCASLESRVIRASRADSIFEWWHSGCYERRAQHTLIRLIAGATGLHSITYARRGSALEAEQRAAWIDRIAALELGHRERLRGSLTAFESARLEVWNGEYKSAVTHLQPLADAGDAEAMELLGRLFVEGWGVPQDYTEARRRFEKAIELGSSRAAYSAARLYDDGLGVEPSPERALVLYRRAGEQGVPEAQGRLAYLLLKGPESLRDPSTARVWFERALSNGHLHAWLWLGEIHEAGLGVEKDLGRALAYYRQAARQGEPLAQLRLGQLYAEGIGVKRDPQAARMWWIRAAGQGNEEARRLYRAFQLEESEAVPGNGA